MYMLALLHFVNINVTNGLLLSNRDIYIPKNFNKFDHILYD